MSLFNNSNVHLHMTTDSFDATTLLTGSDSSIFYALLCSSFFVECTSRFLLRARIESCGGDNGKNLLGTVIADSSSPGRHPGDNWQVVTLPVICKLDL